MTKIIRKKLKNSQSTNKYIEYDTKEKIYLNGNEAEMISFVNTTAWSGYFTAKLKKEEKTKIFDINKTNIKGNYLIFEKGEL